MLGGHLYLKLDIILCKKKENEKKIHVIRVVFQDQAIVRACKNVQNWKKRCVFGHINKFWKGHDAQIKKNNVKMCI